MYFNLRIWETIAYLLCVFSFKQIYVWPFDIYVWFDFEKKGEVSYRDNQHRRESCRVVDHLVSASVRGAKHNYQRKMWGSGVWGIAGLWGGCRRIARRKVEMEEEEEERRARSGSPWLARTVQHGGMNWTGLSGGNRTPRGPDDLFMAHMAPSPVLSCGQLVSWYDVLLPETCNQ